MTGTNDSTQTGRLKSVINERFADQFTPGERLALLDFPDHDNIGDSAIYCGELDFLADSGLVPTYVSTTQNCDWEALEHAIGDGPIFLHGGGNFGDLWPWFQPFREDVLTRFPGRRVIQFPQTLFYQSAQALAQTARVIERHGAFTLFVRDQVSFELAMRHFDCDVRLCPDMAFCMRPLSRGAPDHDLLLHLRTDQEAAATYAVDVATIPGTVLRADWPSEAADFVAQAQRRDAVALALAWAQGGKNRYLQTRYALLARRRVQIGATLLSRGRQVITNRLHGHIMSLLLGIPHCVLDNNYGKTSSFMQAWQTSGDNAAQASSLDDALAKFARAHQESAMER